MLELPELSQCVLCLQIMLLLVIERTVSQIHDRIKERTGTAATGPSMAASAVGKGSLALTGKPTVESLGPEVLNPNYRVREEWEPFTDAELQVVRSIKGWLGPEFGELPLDLLVCFVRGYAYHAEWARASFAYLDRCLRWRKEMEADLLATQQRMPPKRVEFEAIVQAGPIGFDGHGHPVVLERFGACQPAKLLAAFDAEAFMLHQSYNREALRAFAHANSVQRKRRLYKTVQVVDLQGFGWSHTDSRMYSLVKACNDVFAWNYPESVFKIIIINAPFSFQVMWKVVRPWIHPITRSKIEIVGSRYQDTFREQGIELTSGGAEDLGRISLSWSAELQRLPPFKRVPGYAPPADVAAIARL